MKLSFSFIILFPTPIVIVICLLRINTLTGISVEKLEF